MDTKPVKKRGRPAQLLAMAELHAFVDYLLSKAERSDLHNQVIEALRTQGFNFEALSEAEKILVKEALKPYREHTKIQLIAEELSQAYRHTAYEEKLLAYYAEYQNGELDSDRLNVFKTMCTRYLKFKAQKLEYQDLELYLAQLEKKQAKAKRTAEDHRKYQLGGALIAAFKRLNIDISQTTPEQMTNRIVHYANLHNKVLNTSIFKQVRQHEKGYFEAQAIFLEVLAGLDTWTKDGEKLSSIEIKKALRRRDD